MGDTCSVVSRALDEPLYATASRVRAWVLIEQSGPWGREPLVESRLDPTVGRAIHEHAHATGVRALLIRRPGRGVPGPRHVFLAHTGRQARWLEELTLEDPGELLDLDWTRLAVGEPPGYGVQVTRPIYLACTNGRHDQCCATWGRPLAQGLVAVAGTRAWECSHIGGDRFAGNLVCLPEGLYYGRVDRETAGPVLDEHLARRILIPSYRGRSIYTFAVQAAERVVRERTGLVGIDDLTLREVVRRKASTRVTFAAGVETHKLRVDEERGDLTRLTCSSETLERPPRFVVSPA